ncbi:MAG TPA: Ig-like domain-containing protein, partial [Gemmataceae bacterium]|nr:Ig-like domain-containing protein [Gemmataceae bacterium]
MAGEPVPELVGSAGAKSKGRAPIPAARFAARPGAAGGPDGAGQLHPVEPQGPGNYNVTIRVTDGGPPNLDDAETILITVHEINAPPALDPISDATIDEGHTLSFTVVVIDPDVPANTLTFTLDPGAPLGATIHPSTGFFSWTPSQSQVPGIYTITVRVTDNGTPVRSATRTFTVTVNEVNFAPVANDDSALTNENTAVLINVLANDTDTDGDTLTITSAGPAGNGSAAIENGRIRYPPNANFLGADSFSYTISDNHGGSASATVTVTVNAVPAAANDSYVTEKSAILSISPPGVLGNDTDRDPADTLRVAAVNGVSAQVGTQITLPSGARLRLNANGN